MIVLPREKVENIPNELSHLQGDFQMGVKDAVWLPLALYSKICEMRKKLEWGLLNIKESGLADFENSQTLQMANKAKIKKWLSGKDKTQAALRKMLYKDDCKSVAIKSFVKSCVKRNA